jgi:hypothetical protein
MLLPIYGQILPPPASLSAFTELGNAVFKIKFVGLSNAVNILYWAN